MTPFFHRCAHLSLTVCTSLSPPASRCAHPSPPAPVVHIPPSLFPVVHIPLSSCSPLCTSLILTVVHSPHTPPLCTALIPTVVHIPYLTMGGKLSSHHGRQALFSPWEARAGVTHREARAGVTHTGRLERYNTPGRLERYNTPGRLESLTYTP